MGFVWLKYLDFFENPFWVKPDCSNVNITERGLYFLQIGIPQKLEKHIQKICKNKKKTSVHSALIKIDNFNVW